MIKAKKTLGQNFLESEKYLAKIIDSASLKKGELVLEIGPGLGSLTEEILKKEIRLIAVEKDSRLINYLREKFKAEIDSKKMILIECDVLESKGLENLLMDKKYKIVANIPYYITGQIMRKFLESKNKPESITILVQKEVAERIVAKDKKESILSISVKFFGKPEYISTVPKGAFRPQPKVDSAILNIENISSDMLMGLNIENLFKIVKLGFSHKRKRLDSNLSQNYDKDMVKLALDKLNIQNGARAEDLSVEKWIELCGVLCSIIGKNEKISR